MTLAENLAVYRDRINKALGGKVVTKEPYGEDPEYRDGTKEECEAEVMELVDFLIFQLNDTNECLIDFEKATLHVVPARKCKKLNREFMKARSKHLPFGDAS